ncbi:MAG: efflux RND transporter periplasmic adaptor subunit [Bauldia sp.]|nr:efflux RND transporter periplasmic adaptor subunit [Bauldia sp.]
MSGTRAAVVALLATVYLPATALAAEFVVSPTVIGETKAVFGKVESRDSVPARARLGGTVREIRVDEGSEVAEGDVIAVIVDDKIALQEQAADAQILALESQLKNAQTDLDRAQQLLASGSATQSRVDAARTQVEVYTNQLAAAVAERSVIAAQAAEGKVVAPATGRVLRVPITQGSVVLPGEEIALVAGGGYFLRLSLPERHAAEIVVGSAVLVGDRPSARSGPATVETAETGELVKVYPQIEEGRVNADVEVDGLGDYFVGERTLVWIPVGKRTVLSIPPEAVVTRHGVDYVRINEEGAETEVAVILGAPFEEEGEKRVEVLTGLNSGDRVIVP